MFGSIQVSSDGLNSVVFFPEVWNADRLTFFSRAIYGKSLKLGQIKLGDMQVLISLFFVLNLTAVFIETYVVVVVVRLLFILLCIPTILNLLSSRSARGFGKVILNQKHITYSSV